MISPRVLSLAVLGGLAALPGAAAPEAGAAVQLCVSDVGAPPGPRAVAPTSVARAVFWQLTESQRRDAVTALRESVTRREASVNPLLVDLGEGDPDAALDEVVRGAPHAFGVARSVLAPRYCASDGLCVRATFGRCSSSERAPLPSEARRAAFLAWPFGHAERIEGATLAELDARRRRPGVGLVLGGDDQAWTAEEREFVELLQRREALVATSEARADVAPAGAVEPSPGVGEALVIPTLEAVAASMRD